MTERPGDRRERRRSRGGPIGWARSKGQDLASQLATLASTPAGAAVLATSVVAATVTVGPSLPIVGDVLGGDGREALAEVEGLRPLVEANAATAQVLVGNQEQIVDVLTATGDDVDGNTTSITAVDEVLGAVSLNLDALAVLQAQQSELLSQASEDLAQVDEATDENTAIANLQAAFTALLAQQTGLTITVADVQSSLQAAEQELVTVAASAQAGQVNVSTDALNAIAIGTDGGAWLRISNLISGNSGNVLTQGTDSGLFVNLATITATTNQLYAAAVHGHTLDQVSTNLTETTDTVRVLRNLQIDGYVRLGDHTTVERNALTGLVSGAAYFVNNTTTGQVELTTNAGATWLPVGVTTRDLYRFGVHSDVPDANVSDLEFYEHHNVFDLGAVGVAVFDQTGTAPTFSATSPHPMTVPLNGVARVEYVLSVKQQTGDEAASVSLIRNGVAVMTHEVGVRDEGGIREQSITLIYQGPIASTDTFTVGFSDIGGGNEIEVERGTLIITELATSVIAP